MQPGGGPSRDDQRNLIIAMVLMMVVLLGFDLLVGRPMRERQAAERAAIAEQTQTQTPEQAAAAAPVSRAEAVASTQGARIPIDTPELDGSVRLEGARFDDLLLKRYHEAVDPESPEVSLLSPRGSRGGYDAFFGWQTRARDQASDVVDSFTAWSAPEGARLTPETPVTLTYEAPDGLRIERTIAVDDRFMFTIKDRITNTADAAQEVRPYGAVRREGLPLDFRNNGIVHQGLTGVFGPEQRLREIRYNTAEKHARDKARQRAGQDERIEEMTGTGGWLGISDHYWLTALVPAQSEEVTGYYDSRPEENGTDFRAAYRGAWRSLAPGESIEHEQRLFSGAKRVEDLTAYQEALSIPDFDKAVDWGNFWFLTRPFFALLHFLAQFTHNFGFAILLSTIVIRFGLFPLVYQSNKAMVKLRKLQPKMKEIQERYAADKQRQQQEMIRLYQTEKINPVSGCLPILFQIPIFFALYKTLTVTIEMRHTPFIGWIRDLSAPDPTSIFNLFGLLPAIGFDFHAIPLLGLLPAIGVWPILYGVSMWALQALSPPPTDKMQAQIFAMLPFIFTIMFAGFAAGLVIYWTWSNVLSILQQYVISRRMGVETQLDTFLAKRFGKKAPAAAE
ncbi:MAG: membrane protein insertase YidC [Alphaproteobacteria bacterium]|nr:membrane protein insertase YidC [Alphaproteobacteria bacterium]